MKFPALKNNASAKIKTKSVEEFNTGINDDKGDYVRSGNILKDCENMQFSGGLFCTRSGFKAKPETLILPEENKDILIFPFTVTETVCHLNSKAYNLAYCCFSDNDEASLMFYLVDSDGNILPAGGIDFHRVDISCFFVPVNVMFMVAEPISGSGVFALIERSSGGERVTDFLEASSDFSVWNSMRGEYYIPTVRINGRGERYDEADAYNSLKLPAPERPEELNILTGRHKSYYTSDGFSAIFRLPYGNIPDSAYFTCRVYTSPGTYSEWVVTSGNNSATASIGGVQVTVNISRTLGVMRFLRNSADYPMPFMEDCGLNNIEIITTTEQSGNEDEISSCKGAVALDGRLYIYGGRVRQNCVYCVRQSNPLYFPQSNKIFLGDGGTPVTAIKVQNGKLIAFKPSETYRIITYFDRETVEKESVLPEQTTYIKGDVLGMQTIDNGIGCAAPATIRLCGNRLVWLGEDKSVYALATTTYGNTTNIYKVSQPLGDRLLSAISGNVNPFAVTEGGQYMLFAGEKVFVMNFRVRGFGYSKTYYAGDDEIKSPAWYIWKTPQAAFIGGAVIGGNAIFVCRGTVKRYYYLSVTGGAEDKTLTLSQGEAQTVITPVSSRFKTKIFDFESTRLKRLDGILINGGGSPFELTVRDRGRGYTVLANLSDEEYIRLSGGIPAFSELTLAFSADGPFYISNLGFKYKLLGDRG